jgi:hypothetical protein
MAMFFGVLEWRYSNRGEVYGEEKVAGSIHGGEEFTKIDSWEILFVAMDIACKQFDTLLTWILYLASGGKTTETIERGS